MTSHQIIIHKYNNKGVEMLDIASKWNDLSLGTMVIPEEREQGIEKIKNSIAALETYGDKIIIERNSNYHPGRPLLNWLKKLFKISAHGFGYRAIDVGKIPKGFDKEKAKQGLFFEIIDINK